MPSADPWGVGLLTHPGAPSPAASPPRSSAWPRAGAAAVSLWSPSPSLSPRRPRAPASGDPARKPRSLEREEGAAREGASPGHAPDTAPALHTQPRAPPAHAAPPVPHFLPGHRICPKPHPHTAAVVGLAGWHGGFFWGVGVLVRGLARCRHRCKPGVHRGGTGVCVCLQLRARGAAQGGAPCAYPGGAVRRRHTLALPPLCPRSLTQTRGLFSPLPAWAGCNKALAPLQVLGLP